MLGVGPNEAANPKEVNSWRLVEKREFGEVCRPENWDPSKIDQYDWTPLPVRPANDDEPLWLSDSAT